MALRDLFKEPYRAGDDLMMQHAEFNNLRAAQNERVTRMNQYRTENLSVRDSRNDLDVRSLQDYGRRPKGAMDQPIRHRLTIPLGKALNVKHAYRIAGAPFDMTVDARDDSFEEEHRSDVMEKVAWAVYRHSRGETTIASGAWDGSEIGSTVFDMYMDAKRGIPCFRRIDPVGFFEVQGVDDPHDFERAYRVWSAPLSAVRAQYRDMTFRGDPISIDSMAHSYKIGNVEMVEIIQCCDKNKVTRWTAGAGGDSGAVVGVYEDYHGYGFTPYVVIPNIGPYEDVWGWADYEFVRSLAAYLPALMGREADVLKSVANGAVIERGTGVSPETVSHVIRDGGVLPSRRDGSVEPIQAPDMPTFHAEHSKRAMDLFKMMGFAPDAAWGLPGSGSGTDRGLQLQPLLEYTGMKQMNWQAGMARLFGMAFQLVESKTITATRYSGSVPSRNGKRSPFRFVFGPEAQSKQIQTTDEMGFPEAVDLPMTPKEVFDGEYEIRVSWRNRIDPDDPQYVMSEMNKFTQGAQSLETTLENLGVQAPEDEMQRIEDEADRFPWINNGMVALLKAQMSQDQGAGGGPPSDPTGDAMATMTSGAGASGGLNADAATAAQGPETSGPLYGGA